MLGSYSEQPSEEAKLRKAQSLRGHKLLDDIREGIPLLRTRLAINDVPTTDDPSESGSGI
ncbi:MAG: hypothetical protein WA484_13605 [Solirubrobacteraceae bacterium]